jgi:hypothetical protein
VVGKGSNDDDGDDDDDDIVKERRIKSQLTGLGWLGG